MEHRANLSAAEREIERIEVRRKKLIEMVMDGVPPAEVKDAMIANAGRREASPRRFPGLRVVARAPISSNNRTAAIARVSRTGHPQF